MADHQVRVPAAYSVVLERLRRDIMLSRVSPGERFPPEREHAERLGVSRVTLREALRVLEGEGLIEVRRGVNGGSIVKAPAAPDARTPPALRWSELQGLLEFRARIEPLAARRAAERPTDEGLGELEGAVRGLDTAEDVATFRSLDSAFHLTIAQMADLPLLLDAIETTRMAMFEPLDRTDFDVVLPSTQRAHRRILAAITDGNATLAERRMASHLADSATEVADVYTRFIDS
ncbi:FadR/GntR family transcriptional regulator [Nakamurella leprariae]|uniref:FadR family transcriptional regulator n=1 Tax=Nakamurella leprariae TaxID=2803911 RepID=A0A938YH09_9ACTN|nr:FCD domain-containing protein [Nakamurella leprariae]MBM9467954.1 FadR family transcriptional regulator [Nakamurella leprariae]